MILKQIESKQKKIIKTLVGLVLGLGLMLIVQQVIFKPSIDRMMMDVAVEMNKSCPMMVEDFLRLDNVVAMPGNIFQYNYTLVHITKETANISQLTKDLEISLVDNIKSNPDLQIYRDNHTTMAHNYRDKDGKPLVIISVSPSDYEE